MIMTDERLAIAAARHDADQLTLHRGAPRNERILQMLAVA